VRVDSGITTGDIITGSFDSLLAKLIVTGATRKDALEKARRALKEFEITGLPTVLPFHRAIVEEPAFCAEDASDFLIHTRWIETEFETAIEPWDGAIDEGFDAEELYRTVVVEVEGRRLKVGVPAGIFAAGQRATLGKAPKRTITGSATGGSSEGRITSPMQATVVKVLVEPGSTVVAGDLLCVLEAMKMEQPIMAPMDGTVESVGVSPGDSISGGHVLVVIS
jgi:acetyl-CoA/propionyl-CoA carboxylase biotin carboxyl carrier protein